jgi:16S rRNA (adenine1518-N6/adenine1519-N6)-dimethyltransferase
MTKPAISRKQNSYKKVTKGKRAIDHQEENMPRKKKSLGQHFLRKETVVFEMLERVTIGHETSVMEIGCGDGFLTSAIIEQTASKQLWCIELDPEWKEYVEAKIKDPRLRIIHANILDFNFSELAPHAPWVLLANIPYQITFPILFKLQEHKQLFKEGVLMVQEEVAQKLVAKTGRSCNTTSLFLQYHFDFELLQKIEPEAFTPPPKVFSRLVYFKPKEKAEIAIEREPEFWDFLKLCYKSPRQTIKNNLKSTHFSLEQVAPELLALRAQQCTFQNFIEVWHRLISEPKKPTIVIW